MDRQEQKDNNNLSEELLGLIEAVVEKKFLNLAKEYKILTLTPVIVKSYNPSTKRATIAFMASQNVETKFSYANKTGRNLVIGQKVYLISLLGDYSQGWLDDNLPFI